MLQSTQKLLGGWGRQNQTQNEHQKEPQQSRPRDAPKWARCDRVCTNYVIVTRQRTQDRFGQIYDCPCWGKGEKSHAYAGSKRRVRFAQRESLKSCYKWVLISSFLSCVCSKRNIVRLQEALRLNIFGHKLLC